MERERLAEERLYKAVNKVADNRTKVIMNSETFDQLAFRFFEQRCF